MALVKHGRREGQTRSAVTGHEQRQEFQFGDGHSPLDIRSVKVLSREDYNRIQRRLHRHEIQEEKRRQQVQEKEDMKQMSHELVKNWSNTVLGGRQQKLEERRRRLEKEEKERVLVDVEEAKYEAEKRRDAIEKAKTLQYYQTDRVKAFHSALTLTEVMKERDAQLELKRLKDQANQGVDSRYLEMWQKDYEESIQKDQASASRRIKEARDTAAYQKAQIQRNIREQEKFLEEEATEGNNIRRLAVANILERQRLEQIGREEQRRLLSENLRQIDDVHKMKEIQRLQEEEEDEECRIFAAAKKKMMRLRVEKERELHTKKQENLNRIKDKLSTTLSALVDDENDRMNRAVEETEAKADADDAEKTRKANEMLASISQHRHAQMQRAEEEAKAKRLSDLEMIRARKAADVVFRQNEAEKRQRDFMAARNVSDYQLAQAHNITVLEKQAMEEDLKYDEENQKLVDLEERQFQEYASKVIEHCKRGGRNTYVLEKASNAGAGGGLGPQFPGKGGVRPSYLTADQKGIQLPHYKRPEADDIKKTIYGSDSTHNRLGFVW